MYYQVPFQDLPLVIVNVLFVLVRLSLGVSVRRVGGLLRVEPFKKDREKMWEILINLSDLSFFKGYYVFRNMAFEAAIHRAKGILFSGPPSSSLFSFDKISIRRKMPSSRGKEKFFFFSFAKCFSFLKPPPQKKR